MIDAMDKKIYFPRTFNEQMAWIVEEVEHIIKYNAKNNIKKNIQEKGVDAYDQTGYTHAINRLFEIIKSGPKNKAVLQEVCNAELIKISHDTLTFTCRKLSESEAKELMDEAEALCALIVDCKPEEMLEHLINKETFTLWWD